METETLPVDSSRSLLAEIQEKFASQSTPSLALALFGNVRVIGAATYALVKQRPMIQHGQPFTWKENVAQGILILHMSPLAFTQTVELARRVRKGESLSSLKYDKDPDLFMIAAVSATSPLLLARAIKGESLIKNRPLTRYGRISNALSALHSAVTLGIHLRETSTR